MMWLKGETQEKKKKKKKNEVVLTLANALAILHSLSWPLTLHGRNPTDPYITLHKYDMEMMCYNYSLCKMNL